MYSSGGICFDSCTAEHPLFVQPHLSPSDLEALSGSVTEIKDGKNLKGLPDRSHYGTENIGLNVMRSDQEELSPYRKSSAVHLSTQSLLSPPPGSYNHYDWGINNGRQAKRARVENIIKGITCTDVTNKPEETDYMKEEGSIQELPLHQKHRERSESSGQNHVARKWLEKQHQHTRQIRTDFKQMEGETEETDQSKEEKFPKWNEFPERSLFADSCSEFASRTGQGWKKGKLMNYFQSKPDRIKLMADVLKYELSRAVSRSVDSIFKSMPLLQTPSSDVEHTETAVPNQESVFKENNYGFSCCGTAEVQVPYVQTEALSLVVQKPDSDRPGNFAPELGAAAPLIPKPLIPFSHESARPGGQMSKRDGSTDHQRALRCWQDGCPEAGQSNLDTHWNSVKIKSKFNSRSVRSPQTHPVPMEPMLLESLCLPHVKLESDNLEKNNPYMLNECLTTNHLKKAKLMFFYTRYPSSLVLRMCFHDVQFTRCITSQLIKWFSNFREFYYIQMEKFARNALVEGVVDARDLTVDRESELFRALNMHYNKSNDFQVPERFLEVAEITLREFYVAISIGKDHDPSWKKAIYKVICKLDSDVPAEFKGKYNE